MIELLRSRRSIRRFTEEPVEPEKLELLKEALLRSPSSKNINPWEFILVDNRELIGRLAQCKPAGAKPLETATLAVVVTADETQNDVWIEDCSIASVLVQLTAQSLGLGSCWVQVRNRNSDDGNTAESFVQALLNIPPHYRVLSLIALGNPAQQRSGKPYEELQFEKIHLNGF